ncbi:hypothetical protein HDV05_006203 [Chytridiales sp. JEL 0842]|nr:hypothetical protein HDV05_006203 [Chytridiales sp. JEL 0842]
MTTINATATLPTASCSAVMPSLIFNQLSVVVNKNNTSTLSALETETTSISTHIVHLFLSAFSPFIQQTHADSSSLVDASIKYILTSLMYSCMAMALMVIVNLGIYGITKFLAHYQVPRFPALALDHSNKTSSSFAKSSSSILSHKDTQSATSLFQSLLAYKLIVAIPFGFIIHALGITLTVPLPKTFASFLVRQLLSLAIYDLGIYALHRSQHSSFGMLFHKVHHGVAMEPWDVTNGHPFEFFEAFIPILISPVLFRFNTLELFLQVAYLQWHGALVHSGADISVLFTSSKKAQSGKTTTSTSTSSMGENFAFVSEEKEKSILAAAPTTILDYVEAVIITPRFHSMHHVGFRGNFGGFLSIWDHIFGTSAPIDKMNKKLYTPKRQRLSNKVERVLGESI